MKKRTSLALALILALSLAACSGGSSDSPGSSAPADPADFEPIEIRMATQAIPNAHSDETQIATVEKIKELTEGRVNITIYNNAQLGDANAVFEEVISGSIDMAQITIPEVYDARINAPMLPCLVSSYDQVAEVMGPGTWLDEQITEMEAALGLQHLSVSPEGLCGVTTNKPVTDPAGIGTEKGLKLRVPPNDTFRLPVEALGYRSSTIPYSELYTSIETGIVDGTGAFDPYGTWMYLGDVVNYYYDYQTSGEFTQVIMNKDLFDSLLPQDQQVILECYDQYFYDILEGYTSLENEALGWMDEDPKWTVTRFSEEEHNAFAQLIRSEVWPALYSTYTEEFLTELQTHLPE